MINKYIKLNDDISRLIPIFEAEIGNRTLKELTIYSYQDKRLPPNPILYYHPDTVKELETEGILRIIRISNNIDEHAPKFAGPYFYVVKIFAKKVKEKVQAEQTITKQPPKPLPPNVHWQTSKEKYLLEFTDGKKLEFNDINAPSANYFNLLITNHGLPVNHKTAKEKVAVKKNEDIRSLKKTLLEKIEHANLSKKIKIKSEFKSAYSLLISS